MRSVIKVIVIVVGLELGRVVLGPVDADFLLISGDFLGVDGVELLTELLELV